MNGTYPTGQKPRLRLDLFDCDGLGRKECDMHRVRGSRADADELAQGQRLDLACKFGHVHVSQSSATEER